MTFIVMETANTSPSQPNLLENQKFPDKIIFIVFTTESSHLKLVIKKVAKIFGKKMASISGAL
jgi:hypothetical protein